MKDNRHSTTFCNLIVARDTHGKRLIRFPRRGHIPALGGNLFEEGCSTKADAYMITPGGITIVSVLNIPDVASIDDSGNLYSGDQCLTWEDNIVGKMTAREIMIRNILAGMGCEDAKIRKVICFLAKPLVSSLHRFPDLKVCHVDTLGEYRCKYHGADKMTESQRRDLQRAIHNADMTELYPQPYTVKRYRMDFTKMIYILEDADVGKYRKLFHLDSEDSSSGDHITGEWSAAVAFASLSAMTVKSAVMCAYGAGKESYYR